ncbi:hypothetical protein TERG_08225 [Paecilomyces variotii No. 5]|uniref:Uncharacterized protein n=1 Tax=Byssochlamys spectabilis (strain No. 5 / NBRC 109023) TaxID=1356009 RepID=V5FV71_BYSSN|nr:hypothetical protein TERG_08225 [Paecilomyces variotii No. 5]
MVTATNAPPTLSLCPTLTVNPTYTPATPLPSDYLWGCPPHKLCHPKRTAADGDCNFAPGPPADTYFCSPDECISSPPILPPVSPDEPGKYIVSPRYYYLNPTQFGLDYGIYAFPDDPGYSWNAQRSILDDLLDRRQPGQCQPNVELPSGLNISQPGIWKSLCQLLASEFTTESDIIGDTTCWYENPELHRFESYINIVITGADLPDNIIGTNFLCVDFISANTFSETIISASFYWDYLCWDCFYWNNLNCDWLNWTDLYWGDIYSFELPSANIHTTHVFSINIHPVQPTNIDPVFCSVNIPRIL